MSQNAEAKMSVLKRLWTKIARFAGALKGIDDPIGDYMLSLGNRLDKLERDVEHLEGQLRSRAGGAIQAVDNSSKYVSRSSTGAGNEGRHNRELIAVTGMGW
jgi:hypothetical protein